MSYAGDRRWSDQYLPELRRLIGPHLLVPSSIEQDTKEAADLVILRARDMTIACRIRRSQYVVKFANQFTLRSRRDNGSKTELAKVSEGWGDWMFYGFAASHGVAIAPWWLIDLHAFRAHFIREAIRSKKTLRWGETPNGDGTHFCWFALDSFSGAPPILIARSDDDKDDRWIEQRDAMRPSGGAR